MENTIIHSEINVLARKLKGCSISKTESFHKIWQIQFYIMFVSGDRL